MVLFLYSLLPSPESPINWTDVVDQSLKKDISYKLWCLSVNKKVEIPGRGHITKWEGLLSRDTVFSVHTEWGQKADGHGLQ